MDTHHSELESLIARYSGGDRACASELCEVVMRYARRWVGPRLDGPCHRSSVDDVLNDIAMQVVQQIGRGNSPQCGTAPRWLQKISVRNVHNYFRKWYKRGIQLHLEDVADLERHGAKDDLPHRMKTQDLVEAALAALKGIEKTITIGIMAGWDVERMLAKTELSRATFFREKGRLLKKLRRLLSDLLGLLVMMCVRQLL